MNFTGISNLGNTCFMNACIQVLNQTYELEEILSKVNRRDKRKKNVSHDVIILEEWKELQKMLSSKNMIVSPVTFVKNIQNVAQIKGRELFSEWTQNDMSEFLLFFIECLHNVISRSVTMNIDINQINVLDKKALACFELVQEFYKKEYSEIIDLFYAISVSEIISTDTKEIYTLNPELYFILDLPIPSLEFDENLTLCHCFDDFVKPELIGGDNSWYHEEKKEYIEIYKKTGFWSFPKIFVITLKRFSSCGNQKNNKFVTFPLDDFDLSKYVSGHNPQQYVYDLFAVCNHYGGLHGGHYNAFVVNSKKEWISYDDETCMKLEKGDIITTNAYCLFYRRHTL